jgi:hypothetical protein
VSSAHLVARVLVGAGRRVAAALPPQVLQRLEDRLFYAIFQVSRVTNDHYPKRAKPEDP